MENTKKIEKEYLILVEGKTDKILIETLLDLMNISIATKEKIQIFELEGKNKLRLVKNLIKNSDIEIKSLFLFLDKDENFDSTKQRAENFFSTLPYNPKKGTFYLILPPKDIEGKELEDYIVEILSKDNDIISHIKKCVKEVSTNKKFGKKVFYTYLLLNDDCNYEGVSYSTPQVKRCIQNVIEKMDYLKEKLRQFFNIVDK